MVSKMKDGDSGGLEEEAPSSLVEEGRSEQPLVSLIREVRTPVGVTRTLGVGTVVAMLFLCVEFLRFGGSLTPPDGNLGPLSLGSVGVILLFLVALLIREHRPFRVFRKGSLLELPDLSIQDPLADGGLSRGRWDAVRARRYDPFGGPYQGEECVEFALVRADQIVHLGYIPRTQWCHALIGVQELVELLGAELRVAPDLLE
jgi:hypothetical protein